MKDEQIIDGVNVRECQCFAGYHCVMLENGEKILEIENSCTPRQKPCKDIKKCVFKKQYKQLKRLEQENKNLQVAMHKDFCSHYVLGE